MTTPNSRQTHLRKTRRSQLIELLAGRWTLAVLAELTVRNGRYQELDDLFLGLGTVALLVGAVGVASIIIISVLERRSEIGLRRAPGANCEHVRVKVLAEAVPLALIGGAVGDRRRHPHRRSRRAVSRAACRPHVSHPGPVEDVIQCQRFGLSGPAPVAVQAGRDD
jgi:hypothetical protein